MKITVNYPIRPATFEAVAECFMDAPQFRVLRQAKWLEKQIRKELLDPAHNLWVKKPVSQVAASEVKELIACIKDRPAPRQALVILSFVRRIFAFAIRTRRLEFNPIAQFRVDDFGLHQTHKVVEPIILADSEIAVFWRAASAMNYPYGPFFKMLCASGQFASVWINARWNDVNFKEKVFLSKHRTRSRSGHIVPLSDLMLEILTDLPRVSGDDFIFLRSKGLKPIDSYFGARMRLSALMAEDLINHGDSQAKFLAAVSIRNFRLRDLRFTVFHGLRLGASFELTCAILGYSHRFTKEFVWFDVTWLKRRALQEWANHLRTITS